MYDNSTDILLNNLENATNNSITTIIVLHSQGYVVNDAKYDKICTYNLLHHLLENIELFDTDDKNNINVLYNKILNN